MRSQNRLDMRSVAMRVGRHSTSFARRTAVHEVHGLSWKSGYELDGQAMRVGEVRLTLGRMGCWQS